MSDVNARIDVRELKPIDRIGTIYSTFDNLKPGEKMELINDHAPEHLKLKLETDRSDQFDWIYLSEGPDEWRILITKML